MYTGFCPAKFARPVARRGHTLTRKPRMHTEFPGARCVMFNGWKSNSSFLVAYSCGNKVFWALSRRVSVCVCPTACCMHFVQAISLTNRVCPCGFYIEYMKCMRMFVLRLGDKDAVIACMVCLNSTIIINHLSLRMGETAYLQNDIGIPLRPHSLRFISVNVWHNSARPPAVAIATEWHRVVLTVQTCSIFKIAIRSVFLM